MFNNSNIGISATGAVLANKVYSNSIGIQFSVGGSAIDRPLADNVVYANTNVGILLENASAFDRVDVVNNTVYQPVGDAIPATGSVLRC